MTKSLQKLIACLLIAALLAGCGTAADSVRSYAQPTPTATAAPSETQTRENVSFSDMEYERPDIDRMRAEMDDLLYGVDVGRPADEMVEAYEKLQDEYAHADSMMSLAYLMYAFEVTEPYYKNEYAYLQSELSALDIDMTDVSISLFDSSSEARELAEESFGKDYVETVYEEESLNDESIQDLLDAEEAQTLIYDELIATFTLLDNGKRWTLDEILGDMTLDYDSFYRLYDAYCAALNESAGEIFLKQLEIRNQIAQKMGYGSYAAYCYDCYERDYTIGDAQKLQNAVKKYIVPVFVAANARNDTYDLYGASFDEQTFLSQFRTATNDFSPLTGEAFAYMSTNDLCDLTVDSHKMGGSFTTYISDYRAPFIFSQWTGSASDITTVIHEFGHFTSYYLNAASGYSASDSLDLAEVDSQALTLLMTDYYGLFYGDLAKLAETDLLIDCMYSLVSGCMEDEFQQTIYQNPDMTLDEINALYKELAVEYGLDDVYGYQGTEWVLISHTFQTPMYYISYAIGMVPSLELYEELQTNPEAAKAAYFSIVQRTQYAKFRTVVEENGLSDVFSEATIREIGSLLNQYT